MMGTSFSLGTTINHPVPDMKVWGQPACPEVKRRHKKKSCKLCLCSLCMPYRAPMMFTCIEVLNRLVVKGGLYM